MADSVNLQSTIVNKLIFVWSYDMEYHFNDLISNKRHRSDHKNKSYTQQTLWQKDLQNEVHMDGAKSEEGENVAR